MGTGAEFDQGRSWVQPFWCEFKHRVHSTLGGIPWLDSQWALFGDPESSDPNGFVCTRRDYGE